MITQTGLLKIVLPGENHPSSLWLLSVPSCFPSRVPLPSARDMPPHHLLRTLDPPAQQGLRARGPLPSMSPTSSLPQASGSTWPKLDLPFAICLCLQLRGQDLGLGQSGGNAFLLALALVDSLSPQKTQNHSVSPSFFISSSRCLLPFLLFFKEALLSPTSKVMYSPSVCTGKKGGWSHGTTRGQGSDQSTAVGRRAGVGPRLREAEL